MNLVFFLLGALTVEALVPIVDKLVELICTIIYFFTTAIGSKIVKIDHTTQKMVEDSQEDMPLMPQIGFEVPSQNEYEVEFEEDEEE